MPPTGYSGQSAYSRTDWSARGTAEVLGGPILRFTPAKRARKMLAKGIGSNKVAKAAGLSNGTISRIAAEMR
jgi:hypothetical protein